MGAVICLIFLLQIYRLATKRFQMKKLPEILRRKEEIFDKYFAELSDIEELCFYKINNQENPVYWFTSLSCSKRDNLAEFLLEEGIQTRRFFYPLHLQPCYEDSPKINKNGEFHTSKKVYDTGYFSAILLYFKR